MQEPDPTPSPVPPAADPAHLDWDGSPGVPVGRAGELVERVRDLLERRAVRAAVVVVVAACVGGWWFVSGAAPGAESPGSGPFVAGGTTIAFARPTAADGEPDREGDRAGGAPSDGDAEGGDIVVHAAGAVHAPGLYRLGDGARIGELITAAGGLAPDADADRINLAEPLRDGVRVYVPRIGEAEAPMVQGPDGSAAPAEAGAGDPEGAPALVDLNDASVAELEELPGIGPATAAAITAHREAHGPFGSVDELLEVRGIGPAKLEQLRPLVSV